ncbi:MAG: polyphenol oxidase family protein [Coriobacteriales bacterium]|jgi:YfiH family protein|nr:polyphenol oxidase family protein [Coriobacteriales bacterium]
MGKVLTGDRAARVRYECPELPWLCAFTTQAPKDYKADTEAGEYARCELAEQLAPLALTWLALEHGAMVQNIPEETTGALVAGDAALITAPGYAAALTTADCIPIILASGQPEPIAAVIHAGWRGLAAGIIEGTVERLCHAGEIPPESIHAWIGPAIAREDYEVGDETRIALLERPAVGERHFTQARPGHWLADLPAMAESVLAAQGISPENILRFEGSTFTERHLHSARRDGAISGRMATVVGIKPA